MIPAALALAGFALFLVVAPRRRGMPISEQIVRSLFHAAAFLNRLGCALDAAILRYRLEKRAMLIDLDSTAERLSAPGGRDAR